MKRFFVVLGLAGLLSLLSTQGHAQFSKGDHMINIGFGLNSYYSGGLPFCAGYEYGVSKYISAGGQLDYFHYHYGAYGSDYNFSALYLSGRVSYHFNELFNINDEKWDIYGGGSLGYRSYTDNYNGPAYTRSGYYGSSVWLGVHAGAKYYFAQNFGAFAEIGALGSTNIRTGITLRF